MTDPARDGLAVVFVCDANRARSPLAAAAFAREVAARGLDAVVRVSSAGVHAREGDPAVAAVADEATRLGLDLGPHRSRPLDDDDLAADLVVTMTRAQLDRVAPRAPGLVARTFTLKELVALAALGPSEDGDDPEATPVERAHERRVRRPRPDTDATDGAPDPDDVVDPMRGPVDASAAMVAEVTAAVARLAAHLLDGPAAPRTEGTDRTAATEGTEDTGGTDRA